jgi:HEPN domain-containing protein
VCPNPKCSGVILTLAAGENVHQVLPAELLDFDGTEIPENLRRTLEEAISCHAAGAYRASAMMVRRLLEEICEDSQAHGRDLHQRLTALREKVTLPEELFEAMGELKALGNDAAHITAKTYEVIGKDEAEDSIELAKEILKARYQLKTLLARLKARKRGAA